MMSQTTLFGEKYKIHQFPRTQYLGSKERLVNWIYENAPKDIETVLDAFSGTSVVGYIFKSRGKRVIGNDFLKFNFHIASLNDLEKMKKRSARAIDLADIVLIREKRGKKK